MQPTNTTRYSANLQDEIDSAALYNALADIEQQPKLASVYRRLAATETRHAEFWEAQLRAAGVAIPQRRVGWRTRVMIWLARRFGPQFVLPTISAQEQGDSQGYQTQVEAQPTAMAAEERSHARLLQTITRGISGGLEGGAIAQLEGRHHASSGNALRAAVLGASDGLLSNFSLVMGVAGADVNSRAVLIAGLAGLLAGAFSMALGEWISVQSSRELYERQIAIEQSELQTAPAEEQEELALIYQAKGLGEKEAQELAARLMGDQRVALDTLAREELGVDPEALGGSAIEAGITSFLLFAVGAVLPVVPFVLFSGWVAVIGSVVVSAAGLFGIGALITLLTGRSVMSSGVRQMLTGLVAAAITFGIGRLVGVSLGG